jgi:hypothetical protein
VSFLSVLAIVLLLWGFITFVRRIAEGEEQRRTRGGPGTRHAAAGDDWDATPPPRERTLEERRTDAPTHREPHDSDAIDYEELERAEDEVRDLGAEARPEDGFEGDDWGPGAPRKPPLY